MPFSFIVEVGGCAKGWFNMKNMCYRAFGNGATTVKTWIDGEKECKGMGGDLAAVTAQYVLCK